MFPPQVKINLMAPSLPLVFPLPQHAHPRPALPFLSLLSRRPLNSLQHAGQVDVYPLTDFFL